MTRSRNPDTLPSVTNHSERAQYTQLAPSDNRSPKSADGRVATEAAWLDGDNLGKRRNQEEERKNEKKV
jgi:hypothetical protein